MNPTQRPGGVHAPRGATDCEEFAAILATQPTVVACDAFGTRLFQLPPGHACGNVFGPERQLHRRADEFRLLVAENRPHALIPAQRAPLDIEREDRVVANLREQRAITKLAFL